ncbi:MAG: methyl-accepting chemotaxis protein, partial [Pseudomonadota bacterium]
MSVVMRIYLGMGAMIALIIVVGGFASFQTNSLANTFIEYRGTAKTSLLANVLTEDLFEARLDSNKYRITKDEKYIEHMRSNIAEIIELEPELYQLMEGYPEQAELDGILNALQEYDVAMAQAYDLQQQRTVLVDRSAESGLKAREQLSEVMATALRDNDAQASAAAGQASTNLLLGRLYLERFLVDNKAEDAARSTKEIEAARVGLNRLMLELQNPRRRSLTQATMDDLDAFDVASAEVAEVILARNALYARMDEIGPEVLARMETALDAVVNRQNTLGPAGAAVAQRSILVVSAIVAIGAVIGGLLAFFTGRSIASRLAKITEDMSELAAGNLDLEIEKTEEKHEIGKMTNAMVVFLENARSARDLDLELKEKEKVERESLEAAREKEAKLQEEQRVAEERDREVERERVAMLEGFQRNMERVLGEAASGNFSNRMTDEVKDESLAELAGVINRLLEATESNISDIVGSIGELAKGNLGVRISGEREGAFERMQNDFNAALTTLSQAMAKIMDSGQNVSGTSAELETSSLGMAKRAENSAAAVEETSAAVEQITASIQQVVKNA